MFKEIPTGLTLEDSLYPPSHISTSSLDTVSPGRARSPLDMEPVQVGRIPVQVGKMDFAYITELFTRPCILLLISVQILIFEGDAPALCVSLYWS